MSKADNRPKAMLDSGAFTAWNIGGSIAIEEYADFLDQYGSYFEHVVNLDLIYPDDVDHSAAVSFENLKYLLGRGHQVMGVFHAKEDFKWLDKMLDLGVKKIALASPTLGSKPLSMIWYDNVWNFLVNSGGYPVVHVHGLAETSVLPLMTYPWSSVDSASWGKMAFWGRVIQFFPKNQMAPSVAFHQKGISTRTKRDIDVLEEGERKILEEACQRLGVPMEDLYLRKSNLEYLRLQAQFYRELETWVREERIDRVARFNPLVVSPKPRDLPAYNAPPFYLYLACLVTKGFYEKVFLKIPDIRLLISYAQAGGIPGYSDHRYYCLLCAGVPEEIARQDHQSRLKRNKHARKYSIGSPQAV